MNLFTCWSRILNMLSRSPIPPSHSTDEHVRKLNEKCNRFYFLTATCSQSLSPTVRWPRSVYRTTSIAGPTGSGHGIEFFVNHFIFKLYFSPINSAVPKRKDHNRLPYHTIPCLRRDWITRFAGGGGCTADPNFAVICSFIEKFGASCGIPCPSIGELQE